MAEGIPDYLTNITVSSKNLEGILCLHPSHKHGRVPKIFGHLLSVENCSRIKALCLYLDYHSLQCVES